MYTVYVEIFIIFAALAVKAKSATQTSASMRPCTQICIRYIQIKLCAQIHGLIQLMNFRAKLRICAYPCVQDQKDALVCVAAFDSECSIRRYWRSLRTQTCMSADAIFQRNQPLSLSACVCTSVTYIDSLQAHSHFRYSVLCFASKSTRGMQERQCMHALFRSAAYQRQQSKIINVPTKTKLASSGLGPLPGSPGRRQEQMPAQCCPD